MNLIIVDDNKQIREGIQYGIEWKQYGITRVRAFADGLQALEVMKEFPPDIIIADIKMPNMDGLQLLEQIRKRKLKAKYILLSAYSDFDYAQKAIRLGADDYILKPVNPGKLIQVIRKNACDLRGEERSREAYYDTFEKSLLYALCHEAEITDSDKLPGLLEDKYQIRLSDNSIFFAVFQIEQEDGKASADKLPDCVTALVREELQEQGVVLAVWEKLMVFLGKGNRSQLMQLTLQHELKMKIGALNHKLKDKGLIMTSGISEAGGVKEAKKLFAHARLALEKTYFGYPGDCVLYTGTISEESISEEFQKTVMEGMAGGIRQKDREEVGKFIKQLSAQGGSGKYARADMTDYLKRLVLYLIRHTGLESDLGFQKTAIENGLHFEESLQKIEGFINCFLDAQELNDENETSSALIKKICSYTKEHCSEPVSLEYIAELYGRTPNYVSSKFKKEVGKSFTSYLIELRIQKAVNLLKYSELPISEVAQQAGFSSYDYFSRTFRKYTGKSAGAVRSGKEQL